MEERVTANKTSPSTKADGLRAVEEQEPSTPKAPPPTSPPQLTNLPYKPRERHRRLPSTSLMTSLAPAASSDPPGSSSSPVTMATAPTLSVPALNVVMPTYTLSSPTPTSENAESIPTQVNEKKVDSNSTIPPTIRKRSRGAFGMLFAGTASSAASSPSGETPPSSLEPFSPTGVTARLQLQSLKAAGQRIGLTNASMGMQMLDTLFEKSQVYRTKLPDSRAESSGVGGDWADIIKTLTKGQGTLLLPSTPASSLPITPKIMKDHVLFHQETETKGTIVVTMSGLLGVREGGAIVFQSSLAVDSPVLQALREPSTRSSAMSDLYPLLSNTGFPTFTCGDDSSTLPLPPFQTAPTSSGSRSRSGSGASITSLTAGVINVAAASNRLNPFSTLFNPSAGSPGSKSSGSPSRKGTTTLPESDSASIHSSSSLQDAQASASTSTSTTTTTTTNATAAATTQENFSIPGWPIDKPVKYNDVSKAILKGVRGYCNNELQGLPDKTVEKVTKFVMASHPSESSRPSLLSSAEPTLSSASTENNSNILQAFFDNIYDEFYAHYLSQATSARASLKRKVSMSRTPSGVSTPRSGDADSETTTPLGGDSESVEEIAESQATSAIDQVESLVTNVMYNTLFCPTTTDDSRHDAALASRVAALHMLDLSLAHLGVLIDAEDDDEQAEASVGQLLDKIGAELESLNDPNNLSPKRKADILVKAHKIVIDGLHDLPSIRLAPVKEESSTTAEQSSDVEARTLSESTSTIREEHAENIELAVSEAMQQDLPKAQSRKSRKRFNAGAGGADLLLPLIIFAVVKANPHRLVSHLLYIQRYRASVCQSGETSYAIVNMTAVVEFLEHVDLAALGLSSTDKVLGIDDLNLIGLSLLDNKSEDTATIISASTRLRDRVTQVGEMAGSAADSANKVLTGVVDSSWTTLRGLLVPNMAVSPSTEQEAPPGAEDHDVRPKLVGRRSSGFSLASVTASVSSLTTGGSRPRASSWAANREMTTISGQSESTIEETAEDNDPFLEEPRTSRMSISDRIANLPGLNRLASGASTPTPDDAVSVKSQTSYLSHLTNNRSAAYARQPLSPTASISVSIPPLAPRPVTPMATYIAQDEQAEEDKKWMKVALEQAEEALSAKEVPVGCVFVKNGEIVAKARNRTNEWHNATLHAELAAIDQFIHKEPLPYNDITLYVTVEPCIMCASALRQLGIGKVIYGCGNDRFGGCGSILDINTTPKLDSHDEYDAYGGYFREEAIMMLRRFYLTQNSNAPKPKNKANRVLKTEFLPIPGS